MRAIDPAGFEEKFRNSIDPWDYRGSQFEAVKRRHLLQACGPGIFGRGLELGCAIGVTSAELAHRCLRLWAVDSSKTAIDEARRGDYYRRPRFDQALLPAEFPAGVFDLIVLSEVAYYLTPRDLQVLISRIIEALAPGGRIVTLHHLRPFDDAAVKPVLAQRLMDASFERALFRRVHDRHRHYVVSAYEKGRRAAS